MKKKTILFIDKNAESREAFCRALENEGCKVISKQTEKDVLRLIESESVDLVFLDIQGNNSLKVLGEIKLKKERLPVIIIGENIPIEVTVEAVTKGAYDIFERPLSLEKILICMKRAFVDSMKEERLQRVMLNREVQLKIAKNLGEMSIFLDVIEDNSRGMSQRINQRIEANPLSDDESAFLSNIDEDAEEIARVAAIVRENFEKTIFVK